MTRRDAGLETGVLGIVDDSCFVDEHHRDSVAHFIGTAKPRVVEKRSVLCEPQTTLVVGASQDLEKRGVERHIHSQPDARRDAIVDVCALWLGGANGR